MKKHGEEREARRKGLVTAGEIAAYVYCPEQWRLQHALRLEPGNRAALDGGTRHHGRKALAERIAGSAIGLGRWLVVLAVVAIVVLWMVFR